MLTERGPLAPELAFPKEEYKQRLRQVQERMRARGIDTLLVSNTSNWAWLTGYDTTMPSCYGIGIVSAAGGLACHTAELEVPCALYNSVVEDVIVYEWYDARGTAEQLADALLERGADGTTIGLEMGYPETFALGAFDTKSYLVLRGKLPKASFEDAAQLILDCRMSKPAAELDYMRAAGRITWTGLQASPVAGEMWFHGGFGYSIGLGMQPSWTEAAMYIAEGEERELVPGMTFHLPICIFVPRRCGTGFSESVAVTEHGCEVLTPGEARELAVR